MIPHTSQVNAETLRMWGGFLTRFCVSVLIETVDPKIGPNIVRHDYFRFSKSALVNNLEKSGLGSEGSGASFFTTIDDTSFPKVCSYIPNRFLP